MKFVLEKLIDNLFTSHDILTFLSSELPVFSRVSGGELKQRRLYRLQIL